MQPKTQILSVKKIKPNPDNPRIVKDDKFAKLVKSIKDFPQMMELRPIVVDSDMVILGGNMRYKACVDAGMKDVPVVVASDLTDEQKREFIIKDNLGYGEWDWETLCSEWDADLLQDWGLSVERIDEIEKFDDFTINSDDKPPFQQMTFFLADKQADQIRASIKQMMQTDEYEYVETFGNDSKNGNALYLIAIQWAESKK